MSGASVPVGYCSASLRFTVLTTVAPCEAVDHQMVVAVLSHRRLEFCHAGWID